MPDLLFVYGTLHPERAPTAIADVVRRFTHVGSGMVRGWVHHFAAYPALRLDPAGDEVPGDVFRVPADAWAALDAYEGYLPERPGMSLFARVRTCVTMSDGTEVECCVYTFGRELPSTLMRE